MDISEFIINSHFVGKAAISGENFYIEICFDGNHVFFFFQNIEYRCLVLSISNNFGKFRYKDIRNKEVMRPSIGRVRRIRLRKLDKTISPLK